MAATQTVPQHLQNRNSPSPIAPRHGVVTLFGYGINARVDRKHLVLDDGIGPVRRHGRFSRVGHGLRRLVVVGSDGYVSLAALRWLADQNASFVMLDRDGSVLVTTGPVRPSDARLRRAQSLARHSGAAVQIARELIDRKLDAQEKLVRDGLGEIPAGQQIAGFRSALATARTIEMIRLLESRAAYSYWSAWRSLPVNFPKKDLPRVPDHWKTFGARVSPLTGSPRLAANPPNAMLNYLYSLLESEARLAVAALGLDPGLGVLHVDAIARDSLACDVMEPIRPEVDAYVLRWISHETLKREWFFEERNGNCRLMGTFVARLSETMPTWRRAVAPIAELVAKSFWRAKRGSREERLPTRLTQQHRREAKDGGCDLSSIEPPHPESFCKQCGASIRHGRTYCPACAKPLDAARLAKVGEQGRIASHAPEAQESRSETQRRHWVGRATWKPGDLPPWLTKDAYVREIQPRLKQITVSAIASTLNVSVMYAMDIRRARCIPHPRHWETLATLVGVRA